MHHLQTCRNPIGTNHSEREKETCLAFNPYFTNNEQFQRNVIFLHINPNVVLPYIPNIPSCSRYLCHPKSGPQTSKLQLKIRLLHLQYLDDTAFWLDDYDYRAPETNIFAPENRPKLPQKERIVFQPSIFRCELLVWRRVGSDKNAVLQNPKVTVHWYCLVNRDLYNRLPWSKYNWIVQPPIIKLITSCFSLLRWCHGS